MYKIGEIIRVKVTGFKDYGIFIRTDEDYTGLIHISEISEGFVKKVNDYAEIGETIYAKVTQIDEESRQLKLSIKDIHYNGDGREIIESDRNGFEPLKEHLNVWINEKIKEIKSNHN